MSAGRWDDLLTLLHTQAEAGTRIDAVIQLGPARNDKIIVKGRPGAFRLVPDGTVERAGITERGGFATLEAAVAAARVEAESRDLVPVRTRYGKGADPTKGPQPRRPEQQDAFVTQPSARAQRDTPADMSPVPDLPAPAASMPLLALDDPNVVRSFVAFARENLREDLDSSGQVLYSGASTLRKGDVYLLGLNPGSDANDKALLTIRQSLDDLVSDEARELGIPRREWNSYVHSATWKGRSLLQKRIVWLFDRLGLPLVNVAASNLVFVRSRDEDSLEFVRYVDRHWPVHECILGIVQPRVVLTYADKAYDAVRERLGGFEEPTFPSGHGNWECRSFLVPGRFRVVKVPHLSRYAIDRHPEVADWIRRQLAG